MTTVSINNSVPNFSGQTTNGIFNVESLRGKNIVIYFYPKDNTPGCTQEACDFRDGYGHFAKKNAEIIGISKDTPARHDQFKKKYTLPFTLLADEKGDICEAYGVINKKSLFGRTFLGIQRSTFLIDNEGKIRAIWRKVKVTGHSQQVLDELNKI